MSKVTKAEVGTTRIYKTTLEVIWEVEKGETDMSIREAIRHDIEKTAACGGDISVTGVEFVEVV